MAKIFKKRARVYPLLFIDNVQHIYLVMIPAMISMSGAMFVRTVAVGSQMVGIGAGLVLAVVQEAAIFVIACRALFSHVCFVCVNIRKTERGCAGFEILRCIVKVLTAVFTA